uniref:Uncharacterized protein n=1 Tax=Anguilla anguilla TaxID=7936 RepID=A0A0E9SG83_ANGAN
MAVGLRLGIYFFHFSAGLG